MLFKKLQINALLFSLLLNIHSIQCMEKKDTELYQSDEHHLSLIETIPNELLFLVFYSKIDDIINTNNASQGKEEFKTFLSTLRLTNRQFYSFVDELKKYFVMHKKSEVSDITVDLKNYTVNFKIGNITFKSDANIDDDLQFLTNIIEPNITEAALTQAGQELAKKAKTPQDLRIIANDILRAEYDRATTDEQKNRIVALIKPILIAYKNSPVPQDEQANYWTNNMLYKQILEAFFGTNIPVEFK